MGHSVHISTHPLRPTYTDAQLFQYFNSLAPRILSHRFTHDLNELTELQRHHLTTFPFENLSLHYSPTHTISLDADVLYTKFVRDKRGRGGYCMENNAFFGTILRSLGYEVTSVGARVCDSVNGGDGKGFGGWSHMVNIVTLEGTKYMLDVGFGGNGPTSPLPLQDGLVHDCIPPSEMRLTDSNIESIHTDREQRLWSFQVRQSKEADWQTQYCFTETEFLPQDYEIMNFWTSTSRKSIFTQSILLAKMVMEEGEVMGNLTMFNAEAKRKVRGEVVESWTCKTEKERVEVLREWFGIRLTEEEERGIGGLVTELKG
ncbi:MAG: hypothetical protein Q9182_006380 [Xanthomendoza sp. 2 TL-2023]